MSNSLKLAVDMDEPIIYAGEVSVYDEFIPTHDITLAVLECAVEYLASYGKQFTYEFEGSRYILLAAKIEPDGQAG